jgi:hypothetical protein
MKLRRPTRRSAPAVAAVAVALGVSGYLAAPSLVWFADGIAPVVPDDAAVSVPSYGERGSEILGYQHAQIVTVTFPLTNEGILPVTVTDVRLTDEPRPLVDVTMVSGNGRRLPAVVFAGETIRIELRARFDHCRYYHEREMQTLSGAVVHGRTLGRVARGHAEFNRPFIVHSPMIVGCPDRTLRRDDDVR